MRVIGHLRIMGALRLVMRGLLLAGLLALALQPAHGQQVPGLDLLGQVGGKVMAVTIQGHYLYQGEGSALRIMDITTPTQPVEVGAVTLYNQTLTHIAISGDMAYIVGTDTTWKNNKTSYLEVVDISNPIAPERRSSTKLTYVEGIFPRLAINGNLAYVANYQLSIYDIGNTKRPILLNQYPNYGACDVAMRDGLVYLPASNTLKIFDFHDPHQPVKLSDVKTSDATYRIHLTGNLAVLGGINNKFSLVDISDPYHPRLIGQATTNMATLSVQTAGSLAYLTEYGYQKAGLYIYDLSNPTTPTLKSQWSSFPHLPLGLALSGQTAFVTREDGLQILDVSNPAKINALSTSQAPPPEPFYDAITTGPWMMTISDTALKVLDLSQPDRPRWRGKVDNLTSIAPEYNSLALSGRWGLLANGSNGLQMVDLGDPDHPAIRANYKMTGGNARQVAVRGNLAYLADGADGLRVLDITTPTQPRSLVQKSDLGPVVGVALVNDYLYLAAQDTNYTFTVYRHTDPGQFDLVGVCSMDCMPESLRVSPDGKAAYLVATATDKSKILVILDVSDPRGPSEYARLNLSLDFINPIISVDGDHLYIAGTSSRGSTTASRMDIYDVNTLRKPKYFYTFIYQDSSQTGNLMGCAASGGRILLSDDRQGLRLMRFQPDLQLFTPTGGEQWDSEATVPFHWRSNLRTSGTAVRFELWDPTGLVAQLGTAWDPMGEGWADIKLPLVPKRSDYRLRLVSSFYNTVTTETLPTCTIVGGPMRVQWPQAGDAWTAGSTQWVWWRGNVKYYNGLIRYELWRAGQRAAILGNGLDPELNGEGVSQVWVPALAPGDDYTLRVVSTLNPQWYSESGPLTINNDGWTQTAVAPADWTLYR